MAKKMDQVLHQAAAKVCTLQPSYSSIDPGLNGEATRKEEKQTSTGHHLGRIDRKRVAC